MCGMRLLFLFFLLLLPFLGVSQETSKVDSLEVFFGYNEDVVAMTSSSSLISPSMQVVGVAGHTCVIGEATYNTALGMRRAQAVATVLRAFGLAVADSVVTSYGELSPAYRELHKNRRVVVYYSAAGTEQTTEEGAGSSVVDTTGASLAPLAVEAAPVELSLSEGSFSLTVQKAPVSERCYCGGISVPSEEEELKVFVRVANAQAARATGQKAKCWAMFYFIAKGRLERQTLGDYSRRFLKQYDAFMRRAKVYNRIQERRSPVSDGKNGKSSQSRKAGGVTKGAKPFGKFFREDIVLPIAKGLNRASFCVFGRCLFK